jgi:hypothetical protein
MNDKPTFETPEVIESLDELDVLGSAPASTTDVAGSAASVNAI